MVLSKLLKLQRLDIDLKGRLFLKQVHSFVLKNNPCMVVWRERYGALGTSSSSDFGEWVLAQIKTIISSWIYVPNREYHLVIGPIRKLSFMQTWRHKGNIFELQLGMGLAGRFKIEVSTIIIVVLKIFNVLFIFL